MATSNLLLFRLAEYLRARREVIVADSMASLRKESVAPGELPWPKWLAPLVQETSDRLMARAAMLEAGEEDPVPSEEEKGAPEGIERILIEGPLVRNSFLRVLNRFQSEQAERHDFTALEMTEARQETLQEFDRGMAAAMARWIGREQVRTGAIDPHGVYAVHDGLKGVLGLLRLAVESIPAASRIHISAAVQQLARLTTQLGEAASIRADGTMPAPVPATQRKPAPALPHAPAPISAPSSKAAPRETLRLAPLHISSFLNTLTEAFRPAAEGKGLRFEARCSAIPEIIQTDAARLHRAASLILDHAVSHTATGAVVMTAGLGKGGRWTLGVRNTGSAIPAELLSNILMGLGQAGPEPPDELLGIALARDLADVLGGQLEADAKDGDGTHFRLTLPLN